MSDQARVTVRHLPAPGYEGCGLYRLHWQEGGSSLVAVGVLYDGQPWFAPINWTARTAEGVVSVDWGRVERMRRLEVRPCEHGRRDDECLGCLTLESEQRGRA